MRRPLLVLVLALLAPAIAGCGSSGGSGPDAGNAASRDGGTVLGDCGDLAEGKGECDSASLLSICEGDELVQYSCPQGSACEAASDLPEGVACICDDLADGVCPDSNCIDDPDCGTAVLPACEFADASYSGALLSADAFEGNPQNVDLHFLSFNGQLNTDPDYLQIVAFYKFGVNTGTFTQWPGDWVVELQMDRSDGFPSNKGVLPIASGTLEITSVEGNMTGTLKNAVFVDSRETPTCQATIGDVVIFNETIQQP